MSKRKIAMKQKARKEYMKERKDNPEIELSEEKQPPSYVASFFMLFAGAFLSLSFYQTNIILAMATGTPFMLIGMKRMMDATSAQYNMRSRGKV